MGEVESHQAALRVLVLSCVALAGIALLSGSAFAVLVPTLELAASASL